MGEEILGEKLTFEFSGLGDYLENSTEDYNGSDACCPVSPCSFYSTHEFNRVFLPLFYSIIFLLGLPGNLLVIGVLQRYKQNMGSTDTFILHLAVADILLVITLPFWAVEAVHGWVFGTALCKLIGSVFTINFYSGIFLLVSISFDRYLSIVHAIQMYKKQRSHLVHLSCATIWALCLLLTIPDLVFLKATHEHRQNTTECRNDFHPSTAKYWRTTMRFIYHVVGFFLPLVFMFYCYFRIVLTLLHSQGFQKHKAMRVIVAVVVAFFLCWAPYNLAVLMDSLLRLNIIAESCELETQINIAISVTSTLGYVHCCLNPLLYAFVGTKFRNSFLEFLSQVGCISSEFMKKFFKPQRRNSNWSESADTSYSGI
ncbi:C-X-C chemokine receptor type 3-like [Ambystoma mexicanum]|uniref:C-X-C chemokine receptor type 3-like n=1 Tax=Ambystoma mexicanum TaxID=8296 RepID=UPI0037E80FA4